MRGTHSDRGSASIEIVGILPLLLLGALFVWQMLLVSYTLNSAENAARTASRAASLDGDGETAALNSLSDWLRDDAEAVVDGTIAHVTIKVPLLFPGLTASDLTITRSAEMPGG
jgi:hypothetical protein